MMWRSLSAARHPLMPIGSSSFGPRPAGPGSAGWLHDYDVCVTIAHPEGPPNHGPGATRPGRPRDRPDSAD